MDLSWHNVLRLAELPWLNGHQLQGQTVFPAAAYVALAIEAAIWVAESNSVLLVEVHDLVIGKAITFESDRSSVETKFSLTVESNEQEEESKVRVLVASFRAHSTTGESSTGTLNSTGRIKVIFASEHSPELGPLLGPQEPGQEGMMPVDEEEFYTELKKLGYHYSGSFRALQTMSRKFDHGRGFVSKPQRSDMHGSEQELLVHPGFLDAAFQAIFLAFSWPGDGRLHSLHVPVSIRQIRVDATVCRENDDIQLAFDSVLTGDSGSPTTGGIIGDVDIFNADGSRGLIQVEGIRVIPFAATTADEDIQMFFENVVGIAFPDGELAIQGNTAPEEELAMGWVLERISYFYLRNLTKVITPDEEAAAAWHHQKLLAYARHIVEMVETDQQAYAKKEWNTDTVEDLHALMDRHSENIDVRLMRSVGEHLAANVRGETLIIEHMMKDGMLDQYYVKSLGLEPYTAFLSNIIAQITHVHPHLRILEIGAGTGGATKSIMRQIDGAFDSYTFTDISAGFFETARGVFAEYAGRMSFEVLDAEKDVGEQGFKEQSYDLIIASLVLHATKDLQYTLSNVRRLLRPGGFLVMIENTSNATLRLSFTMGGLAGWWLGAETGRPWSPGVSSAQWHSLLLDSGFTGVEASTPERDTLARPFSVLVSRATDEHVDLLISPSLEPSPLSALDEVVIITGASLEGFQIARTAQRLLRPHCPVIRTVTMIDELASEQGDQPSLSTRASVLNLADWDEPVFQNLRPSSFTALKSIFSRARSVVWATKGRQNDQPYANLSAGFGRAMTMEYLHLQLHLVDFETGAKPSAQVLVDALLRMSIRANLSDEEDDIKPLWNHETETFVDVGGRTWVQRVKPHGYYNDRYNASRRPIKKDVTPWQDGGVHLNPNAPRQWLQAAHVTQRGVPAETETTETTKTHLQPIQVLYTSNTTLNVNSFHFHPAIGIHQVSNQPVVVLASSISSLVDVHPGRLTSYPYSLDHDEAPARLKAISDDLLASLICSEVDSDGLLLLLEPDEGFARAIQAVAETKRLRFACLTTHRDAATKSLPNLLYLHPRASSRTLQERLPGRISHVIDCSNSVGENDSAITTALQHAFGKSLRLDNVATFRARDSALAPVETLLEDAVESAGQSGFHVQILNAQAFAADQARPGAILDWTATKTVPLSIAPSDSIPLLQPNRTYLLVGLAGKGGLGLSLAEYLIRQGAQNIVLTSRNPQVNNQMIARYAAQGVRIAMMANDVTDEASLRSVIAEVRASWPPIAGVANGAMVLQDTSLETMSYEQMVRVLRPKVIGTRLLDEIFRNDPLDFFVMFSSLASVFGNSGQANYSAANMYMMSVAAQRRKRGVAASVIDIGAIMGTGYMAREVTKEVLGQLTGAGYRKMSERDFHLAFANAIISGRVGSKFSEELITGLYVAAPGEDVKPIWSGHARFGHVVRTGKSAVATSLDDSSLSESIHSLLERARTPEDITQILQSAIIDKLEHLLQLSPEVTSDPANLLEQGMDSLGIDSLVAVELRSWLLREIDVDLPILKILGETSVRDIVEYAREKLPVELIPSLGLPGSADLPALGAIRKRPTPLSGEVLHQNETNVPSQKARSVVSIGQKSVITLNKTRSNSSTGGPDDESSNTSLSEIDIPSDPKRTSLAPLQALSPPKIEKTAPMSWGQSRFWVMNQIVEDPNAFNVTCLLEITGPLDQRKLTKAVSDLGARHEALRTCFFEEDHLQPVQGILQQSALRLEILNPSLSIKEAFKTLQGHSYDLSKGDTLKIQLLSNSPTKHVLFIGYHHINMDSTSLVILVNDLRRLYTDEKLSPPRLQYPDFAVHQLERLRNGHWDDQLKFWRKELSTLPDPLPILNVSSNTTRPRSPLTSYNNIHAERRISEKLTAQVHAISRALKVTAFHVYCTVFQILIARLAALDDVCIGFGDANRTAPGSMESIGNFLNLLPLRLPTDLTQPFSSLVKLTKSKILAALAHSVVPFDVILEEVGVPRSSTHSPLFQAFIDYRHVDETVPFGRAQLKGKEYALSKTPYDVMLDLIDTPAGGAASLNIIVQENLYSAEEAQLLLDCYVRLLTEFTGDSNLAAGNVDIFGSQAVNEAIRLGQGKLALQHGRFYHLV